MEVAAPARMARPCDYGLMGAITALETQLGSIEAYNRLAEAAHALKAQIDAGKAKPQNPMFATSAGFHPEAFGPAPAGKEAPPTIKQSLTVAPLAAQGEKL